MSHLRKRSAIAGLMLGIVAVASYFTVVTVGLGARYPWLRDSAALNLALMAMALGLSIRGLGTGGRGPWIMGGVNTALATFLGWYLFVFSATLPVGAPAPAIGARAPDFSLTANDGRTVTSASLRGTPTVLVFYRGFW